MKRIKELLGINFRALVFMQKLIWGGTFRKDPGSVDIWVTTKSEVIRDQHQKAAFALMMLRAGKLLSQANIARPTPVRDS